MTTLISVLLLVLSVLLGLGAADPLVERRWRAVGLIGGLALLLGLAGAALLLD